MLPFLTGFTLSALAARAASRLPDKRQNQILNLLALLFPLSEIWKQLLLVTSNQGGYPWWYFPFQLCSMPLYLLPLRQLLLTRLHRELRCYALRTLTDFLADFGLLAGVFAFADQSGMHYTVPALTVHSYLWHFSMIFLGLFLIFSGRSQKIPGNSPGDHPTKCIEKSVNANPLRGFLPPAVLFLLLAAAAELLNLLLHTKGSIDLFYISPWEPATQVILRDVAARIGRGPEILLYLGLIVLGAGMIHVLSRLGSQKAAG